MNNVGKRLFSLTIVFVLITLGMFGCAAPTAAPATAAPISTVATAAPVALPTVVPPTVVPPTAAPKSLNIGDIETLTGASSDNLKTAASGSYLAEQYINNHGGIKINGDV